MGYGELLRVLEEEASSEAREIREAAARERDRIVAEARRAADAARSALLERDRALLVERRRLLEDLHRAIGEKLPAPAGREVLATLLAEVVPEAWDGPVTVVVDPGEEAICRNLLANVRPELLERAEIQAAPRARGGVEIVCGRRVLDDTLPARLERAWPGLEAELAGILFEGG